METIWTTDDEKDAGLQTDVEFFFNFELCYFEYYTSSGIYEKHRMNYQKTKNFSQPECVD